jgi:hypothetical protein
MFLIVAAAVLEVLFRLTRSRDAKTVLPLAGAAAGLIVAASMPLQRVILDPTSSAAPGTIAITTVAGIGFGALAGFLGGRFITMLRALAPVSEEVR